MSRGQNAAKLAQEVAEDLVKNRLGISGAVVIVFRDGDRSFGTGVCAPDMPVDGLIASCAHAVGMLRALATGQHYVDSTELAQLRADAEELRKLKSGDAAFVKALDEAPNKIDRPMHSVRVMGLKGHCAECNAKPGEVCR